MILEVGNLDKFHGCSSVLIKKILLWWKVWSEGNSFKNFKIHAEFKRKVSWKESHKWFYLCPEMLKYHKSVMKPLSHVKKVEK